MDKGLNLININRKSSDHVFVKKEELKELREYKKDVEFLMKMVETIFGIVFYTGLGFWLGFFILK